VTEELRPGLWTWSGPHPDWKHDDGGPEGWEQEVRSYAFDAGDSLVLFDPLAGPELVEDLARDRPIAIVLTCRWHARSTPALLAARGATAHAPSGPDELSFPAEPYAAGDVLVGGVEAREGGYPDECVLWIPGPRALVIGDALLGGERGFRVQPDSWLAEELTRDALRDRLRPLLELPVELLLPTHGDPVVDEAHDALRRALDA
jgi:hypothetical protein